MSSMHPFVELCPCAKIQIIQNLVSQTSDIPWQIWSNVLWVLQPLVVLLSQSQVGCFETLLRVLIYSKFVLFAGDIENGPYVPSAISSLFLGGRVKALHGGHLVVTGVVWYRGKLPGITEDIVGIEIDQVGLGGDGTFQGHRYFRWYVCPTKWIISYLQYWFTILALPAVACSCHSGKSSWPGLLMFRSKQNKILTAIRRTPSRFRPGKTKTYRCCVPWCRLLNIFIAPPPLRLVVPSRRLQTFSLDKIQFL